MATVVALLANAPGMPDGDTGHGMTLRLCLTPTDEIDKRAYDTDPLPWRGRRYWPHRTDWWGELVLVDEAQWGLRAEGDPDEPLWNVALRVIRPGEYLTLYRPNGEALVFRIVQVEQD